MIRFIFTFFNLSQNSHSITLYGKYCTSLIVKYSFTTISFPNVQITKTTLWGRREACLINLCQTLIVLKLVGCLVVSVVFVQLCWWCLIVNVFSPIGKFWSNIWMAGKGILVLIALHFLSSILPASNNLRSPKKSRIFLAKADGQKNKVRRTRRRDLELVFCRSTTSFIS